MKLILVRHGESELNGTGIVQGDVQAVKLTPLGIEQSKKVAERLRNERIDFAYVSPLDRTRQTADAILQFHPDTQVVIAAELKERKAGKYQGGPRSILVDDVKKAGVDYLSFKPEGGESWYEAGARVLKFYRENILPAHQGTNDTVLIVGHGNVFMYLLLWLDGIIKGTAEPQDIDSAEYYKTHHLGNATVSEFEVDADGHHRLIYRNDSSHLV